MSKPLVPVAVGVIENAQGEILIAGRTKLDQMWEFPGGKLEPGETVEQALARELLEEIGVVVVASQFLFTMIHHYEHISVQLHVCKVTAFEGIARGLEGQPIQWMAREALAQWPMLAANRIILDRLQSTAA